MAGIIQLLDIHKRFGEIKALDGVSLTLSPGEIHAVLGENGAGKSTLMKVLAGLIQPDSGAISVAGKPISIRGPGDAGRLGLGMVHQHFMLVERMTVAQNVWLARGKRTRWLTPRAMERQTAELARRLTLDVDPAAVVADLSVGRRQRVELLKVLQSPLRFLILDEPTAVLTPDEVESLFNTIRSLRDTGCGIIFISHKLDEVPRICERMTVIRSGRTVWVGPVKGASADFVARQMVGGDESGSRKMPDVAESTKAAVAAGPSPASEAAPRKNGGEPLLELRGVLTAGTAHAPGLKNASLQVGRGAIVGIAGVDGNGQSDLIRVCIGHLQPIQGTVHRTGAGTAVIPDDRQREGLALPMSVRENAVLGTHDQPPFSRRGIMQWRQVAAHARRLMRQFDIRASSEHAPAHSLSGGNQQKLILAREMSTSPALIVAVNPTRGLDFAATAFMHEQLAAAARRGAGILLVSSDLRELTALSTQILVLLRGELAASQWPREDLSEIARLMSGVRDRGREK